MGWKCDTNMATFKGFEIFGIPALITTGRIERSTVPEELNVYSIRHDDGPLGYPCSVSNNVLANHYSDIITYEPIVGMDGDAELDIGLDDYAYTGDWCTLEEFIKNKGSVKPQLFTEVEEG